MKARRWILESKSGQSVVDFKTKQKAEAYMKQWPTKEYTLFMETRDLDIQKRSV